MRVPFRVLLDKGAVLLCLGTLNMDPNFENYVSSTLWVMS